MQVTIVIDETLLVAAAQRALAEAFAAPTYSSDRGAFGYEIVRQQVRAYLAGVDATPHIQQALAALLPAITHDIVATELRRWIKGQVKIMRDEGTLFATDEIEENT